MKNHQKLKYFVTVLLFISCSLGILLAQDKNYFWWEPKVKRVVETPWTYEHSSKRKRKKDDLLKPTPFVIKDVPAKSYTTKQLRDRLEQLDRDNNKPYMEKIEQPFPKYEPAKRVLPEKFTYKAPVKKIKKEPKKTQTINVVKRPVKLRNVKQERELSVEKKSIAPEKFTYKAPAEKIKKETKKTKKVQPIHKNEVVVKKDDSQKVKPVKSSKTTEIKSEEKVNVLPNNFVYQNDEREERLKKEPKKTVVKQAKVSRNIKQERDEREDENLTLPQNFVYESKENKEKKLNREIVHPKIAEWFLKTREKHVEKKKVLPLKVPSFNLNLNKLKLGGSAKNEQAKRKDLKKRREEISENESIENKWWLGKLVSENESVRTPVKPKKVKRDSFPFYKTWLTRAWKHTHARFDGESQEHYLRRISAPLNSTIFVFDESVEPEKENVYFSEWLSCLLNYPYQYEREIDVSRRLREESFAETLFHYAMKEQEVSIKTPILRVRLDRLPLYPIKEGSHHDQRNDVEPFKTTKFIVKKKKNISKEQLKKRYADSEKLIQDEVKTFKKKSPPKPKLKKKKVIKENKNSRRAERKASEPFYQTKVIVNRKK